MNLALLLLRLVLVCIFAIAAIAKLADQAAFGKSVADFGAPKWLAAPLRIAIPILELLVAALLIWKGSAGWGASGALFLLLFFSAAISFNLARGRKPDCHCFGQLHAAPLRWTALVRNGVFAVASAFIVWAIRHPGHSMENVDLQSGEQNFAFVAGLVMILVIMIEGWAILQLLKQNGRILVRMDDLEHRMNSMTPAAAKAEVQSIPGLPIGASAPDFEALALSGDKTSLAGLRKTRKPVLIIFSDTNCETCNVLLPQIATWQRQYAHSLTIAIVNSGQLEQSRQKLSGHELKHVFLQEGREIADRYKVRVTPTAVLLDQAGSIASDLILGPQAISNFVSNPTAKSVSDETKPYTNTRVQSTLQPVLATGQFPPAIQLPNLEGHLVELHQFRGRDTLVVHWNPNCGFCKKMLPDLRAWEDSRTEDAPELLVISTGSVESNRALQLRSTLLLDTNLIAGRALGMTGTPSALLLDAEGRVASPVARGTAAVLSLARSNTARTEVRQL